jgi:predicted acyltransferase
MKAAGLAVAGVACVIAGKLLDPVFPINKNLWTSSFVLFTSGWSLLLLALFYLVIDVWGYRRWSFFFVVIGMNAITIYMLSEFVDFQGIFDVVFARAQQKVHPALLASGEVLTGWALLYWLYRRRLFLRV